MTDELIFAEDIGRSRAEDDYAPTTLDATFDPDRQILTPNEKSSQFLQYGLPAALAGFADTVGQSLGLIDEEQMAGALQNVFPQFGMFYKEHQEGAQVAGDMVGMFIPGMLAVKGVRAASSLARQISPNSKLVQSLFTSGKAADELVATVAARDQFLAGRGLQLGVIKDDVRKGLVYAARRTKILDSFKEAAAFELGVAATMNQSEVLYPDEFSVMENFLLAAAPAGAFIGAEAVYFNRLLRNSLTNIEGLALRGLDPQDMLGAERTSKPGNRDVKVTINAVAASANQKALQDIIDKHARGVGIAEEDTLATSAHNSFIQSLNADTRHEIDAMAGDNPYRFTSRVQLNEGEALTLMAQVTDPSTGSPVALFGVQSIEHMPTSQVDIVSLIRKRESSITGIESEIKELADDPATYSDKGKIKKLGDLQEELNRHKASQFIVYEPNGGMTTLQDYRIGFHDTDGRLRKTNRTQIEPGIWKIDFNDGQRHPTIGIDEEFNLVLPAIKDVVVNGVNVTHILPLNKTFKAGEDFSLILLDMGYDWHFMKGTRGKDIFESLPREIQSEIHNWTGSSSSSKIREWVESGDPRAQLIYQAYEPMRMRLKELADPDGTITLMRGEHSSETKAIEAGADNVNDVVSMTSDPGIAKSFADRDGYNVLTRRVPIEDVIMIVGGSGHEYEYIVKGNSRRSLGEKITPQSWEGLEYKEKTAIWYGIQEAIDKFDSHNTKFILNPNDHYTKLDAVTRLIELHGDDALRSIDFGSFKDVKQIQFASLAQKFQDYVRARTVQNSTVGDNPILKLVKDKKPTIGELVNQFNLPAMLPDGRLDPTVELFEALFTEGRTKLSDAFNTLDQFEQAVLRVQRPYEVIEFLNRPVRTMGRMLEYNKKAKPVLGVMIPPQVTDYTHDALMRKSAALNMERLSKLRSADQSGAFIVKTIADVMDSIPATQAAKQVHLLQEGEQRGTGLGRPQSEVFRESVALRGSDELASNVDRQANTLINERIFAPHTGTFSRLRGGQNTGSLESFNLLMHANRQGWDLAEEVVDLGEGKFAYELLDTSRNRELWRNNGFDERHLNFDTQMLMPAPARGDGFPTAAVGDELAIEAFSAITSMSRQAGIENNAINRALSLPEIHLKNHHVPPRNFLGKEVIYLADDQNNIIGMVSGKTKGEAQSFAQKAEANYREEGRAIHQLTSDDISKHLEAKDLFFESGLKDFSDSFRQTGKARGRSGSSIIETGTGVLDGAIESLQRQFQSTIRRTRAAYLDPQIGFVKQLHNAASPESSKTGQDVYQRWLANVYGNTQVNPNDAITRIYNAIESGYDDVLNALATRQTQLLGRNANVTRDDKKRFEALEKKLGAYNPYESTLDFMERTHRVKPPASMRKHMAALNNLTTFLTLGMFEAGHALLNLTSLAATMPGVIKAMNRLPHETPEQFGARIGAFGTAVTDGVGMFSPARAIATGIHDWWQPEFREQMRRAANKGYFRQEIAEMVHSITEPRQNYAASIAQKFVDITSVLSRKSEELSRTIAFATGISIAKRGLKLENEDAMFAFAHRFANDVIGDYRPSNRPRMFQGAVGMPLGLFSTFMLNYYNRVFNMIENRQLGALATQYATQASVFGAQTVPGFDQFSQIFASNYDGTVNPVDGFRKLVGNDDITDAIMYGSLSTLPKLFGAEDGIGITTRGDINFVRVPTLFTPASAPGIQMVVNFGTALRKTFEGIRQEGGISQQQMLEIAGNYAQNRALKNMAMTWAGYSVDKRGQVIDDDIRDGLSISAHVMGMRTLQEVKKLETLQRVRTASLSQRDRALQLQDNLGAKIRANAQGTRDLTGEDIANAVGEHMRYGGSPSGIGQYLANQHKRALVDTPTRLLMDKMRIPSESANVERLMSIMDLPANDPEFTD
jgi:hypothetical protein